MYVVIEFIFMITKSEKKIITEIDSQMLSVGS